MGGGKMGGAAGAGGSAGDSSVLLGCWPDGMTGGLLAATGVGECSGAVSVPSGGSSLGMGRGPVLPAAEAAGAAGRLVLA